MARLGALSTASVSTPISLSFCPALLSEDKRQAVNFHGSHGLSVTRTHTQGWIGLFWPLQRMFSRQTEYERIPYFSCVSGTRGVLAAEEEAGVFGFLAEN